MATTNYNKTRKKKSSGMAAGVGIKPKKKKKFTSSWNFSVYNVYNRKNPYFIYLDMENAIEGQTGSIQDGNLTPKAYQVSIFPVLPSITWNFSF